MSAHKVTHIVQKWLGIVVFALAWELLPRTGLVSANFLPPLSAVIATLYDLVVSGEIARHVAISLQRSALGFGFAVLISVPLGIALGWYTLVDRLVDPLLQVFRQLSPFALFPLFILFFGIGELSKVVVIAFACQWPVLLNTIGGVKEVDPLLIKSARSMGLSSGQLFRKVVLPAALPAILTGLRLAASMSLILLIAAEMIGASAGLGFLIIDSQYKFQVPTMYAAIMTIAAIGLIANLVFVIVGRRLTAWKEEVPA